MDKRILLEDRFPTGEPTLLVVAHDHHGRWYTESAAKYASEGVSTALASPAFAYVKTLTPRPGHTIVLVNALGAFEAYDDNRNGDAFPAQPYRVGQRATCGHAECQKPLDGWINPDEVLTRHYQTFDTGKVFKHHLNTDADPAYGKVIKSFWHDRMKRVELLLDIENALAPDVVQRVEANESVPVSMGTRVRWDVCSICGHRAPTRKQYCEHLLLAMRRIHSDGRRICALNPSCRFFDISIVRRPADRQGFLWKKVAASGNLWAMGVELEDKLAAWAAKRADVAKLSDIQKVITGVTAGKPRTFADKFRAGVLPGVRKDFAPLDDATAGKLAAVDVGGLLGTLAVKGAALTNSEFSRVYLAKHGFAVAPGMLDRLAVIEPALLDTVGQHVDLLEKAAAFFGTPRYVPELATAAEAWITKRASVGEYLRHMVHEHAPLVGRGAPIGPGAVYEAEEPARTDVFTMTDPYTGEQYKTNRGAVMEASDKNHQSLLGATALLHTLYAVYGGVPGALALPAAYHSAKGLHGVFHPHTGLAYPTDQGLTAPGNTEFVKSSAVYTKLAMDVCDRVPGATVPYVALLAKVAAQPTGRAFLGAVAKVARDLAADLEVPGPEPLDFPTVAFPALAAKIGKLLVT